MSEHEDVEVRAEDPSEWDETYAALRQWYDRGYRIVVMLLDEETDGMKLVPIG